MALFGFGKREAEALKLTPFSENPKKRLNDLICDGVIAENLGDFATLRATYASLQLEHPDRHVLATLEDPGQAVYTSFHAIEKHQLDDTEGHDLSKLGPECFEDGEHLGYLTTEAELPIRLANLKLRSAQTTFEDACGVLYWEGGAHEGPAFPDTLMLEPDAALAPELVREVHFQFVPVVNAADSLAALPNGYFTCDLTPMQSYAVTQYLEKHYELKLFGVGASSLGFLRNKALTRNEADALARDLVKLYQEAPADAVERLIEVLTGKDWLLLRYTES